MRRFTSQDLFSVKWVSDPQISPDGRSVFFTEKSVIEEDKQRKYKSRIFMARDGKVYPFTAGPKNDTSPRWSPKGDRVVFMSERGEDAAGKDASDEKSDVRVITRIRYKLNGRGFLPDRKAQVFVLDVESKKITQITSGEYDCREPAWFTDGKFIAFTSARYEGNELSSIRDIYVVPAEGGEMRKVTSSEAVLAVAQSAGGDMGGSPGTRPSWSCDNKFLFFSALDMGRTHLYKADVETKEIARLTSGDCLVSGWTKAVENDTFAVHYQSPAVIGDIMLLDPLCGQGCGCGQPTASTWDGFAAVGEELKPFCLTGEGFALRRLTCANQELLSSVYLSLPEEFEATSQDGTKVQGWLMKPVGMKSGAKYPLALEIHGGPHSAYGFAFVHEFQLLAARGYGVVFSNPRGSIGQGQKWMTAIRRDWGGVDYQDIMAAADWAARQEWVDPARMGILGGSYGGYMTNWVVTHTDRFAAAVTMRSTCNRMSQFGASDAAFTNGDFEFDGDPWDNPRAYLDVSPLMYVRNVKTPVMVIHSEQDLRCPIEQSEEWFTALKKTGKTAIMVRFPNENHELSRSGQPKHRVERLEYITAWFDRYLQPKDEDYASPLERPEKPLVKLPDKI